MYKFSWLVIGALCLLVGAPNVFAGDIYVKAGASGDGSSAASPMPYLWRAVDRANRGDVIHVASGTYNGKGESGAILIKAPDLTIVGGYSGDFSKRDPFVNKTVVERGPGFKAAQNLPRGHFAGDESKDHSGLTIDGFWLNSKASNGYDPEGNIKLKDSYEFYGVYVKSANIKLRNLVIMNGVAEGIIGVFSGEENEISNCFIINYLVAGIDVSAMQEGGKITIKNNSILFGWFRPGKGGAIGVKVGKHGEVTLEKNNIGFLHGDGHGVTNLRENIDLVLNNNSFFQTAGSFYSYMDDDAQNLLVYKKEELEDLNDNAEDYMLLEAEGNVNKTPGVKPDAKYFAIFSNYVAGEPGKLKMDEMNQLRELLGKNLKAEKGTAAKNYAPFYPVEHALPLAAEGDSRGAIVKADFASYKSAGGDAVALDYKEVPFSIFKKGSDENKALNGTAVMFKASMGSPAGTYLLPDIKEDQYLCYKVAEGGKDPSSRDVAFIYILKGSQAQKDWDKLYKRKDRYNKKGIVIRGVATYIGNDSWNYPAGIVVKEVSRK